MTRILPEKLGRLKRDASGQRLAEADRTKTKDSDTLPCPRTTPQQNLWRSLTACSRDGSAGSVIDRLTAAKGASFRHAVELLRAGD